MIDASNDFMKDGNKNRLRHQDIRKIVDIFNAQLEVPKYARMVPFAEIRDNDFNLNIPRYIDSSEPEDLQDIEAHLKGGIPNRDIDAMEKYWQIFPSLKNELFAATEREGYSELRIGPSQIRNVVQENREYQAYLQRVQKVFESWQNRVSPLLSLSGDKSPKEFIEVLSEVLFEEFADLPLIDKYDIYQYLMDYWTTTMQDDVYMILNDGWTANKDLIQAELIVTRYFKTEHEHIAQLESEKDVLTAQKEEMEEEHSGDEGVLEELKSDKGKLSKGAVQKRVKEIKDDPEFIDEQEILGTYLELLDQESDAGKKISLAQKNLSTNLNAKYPNLSEKELKQLVVEDKWLATLQIDIESEAEKISQSLTERVKELTERYIDPLPKLEENLNLLSEKVDAYLRKMGFK
jgi:type I restriction enzyme M protein